MKPEKDEIEERNVEHSLTRLRDAIEPPGDDELRVLARAAAAEARPLSRGGGGRRVLTFRLRWSAVAVAAALLVGSGLGFGVGSSVTPSGSASAKFTGLGFVPARGWTVVQSGTVRPTGTAVAIAANVPLHPDDGLDEVPDETLASLPPRGILIYATFTTRGDPAEDVRFTARTRSARTSSSTSARAVRASSRSFPISARDSAVSAPRCRRIASRV